MLAEQTELIGNRGATHPPDVLRIGDDQTRRRVTTYGVQLLANHNQRSSLSLPRSSCVSTPFIFFYYLTGRPRAEENKNTLKIQWNFQCPIGLCSSRKLETAGFDFLSDRYNGLYFSCPLDWIAPKKRWTQKKIRTSSFPSVNIDFVSVFRIDYSDRSLCTTPIVSGSVPFIYFLFSPTSSFLPYFHYIDAQLGRIPDLSQRTFIFISRIKWRSSRNWCRSYITHDLLTGGRARRRWIPNDIAGCGNRLVEIGNLWHATAL